MLGLHVSLLGRLGVDASAVMALGDGGCACTFRCSCRCRWLLAQFATTSTVHAGPDPSCGLAPSPAPLASPTASHAGENDREMLELCGLGVAMGNAVPAALSVSDALTAKNSEDGVARAVERFVLGPRGLL